MRPPSEPKYVGKYRLERELGRGGMGAVWIALDERLRRQVAIKLMEQVDGPSDGRHERFAREALVIARLQNPHVVQVYDYGITHDGAPYIVMELLEGEDLASRLKRAPLMSMAALAPLFTQMAKALDAAHQAGIVHRDLKPANIFLARQGTETTIKILDFGIATIRTQGYGEPSDITGDNQLVGTPQYMSPEQLRARALDYRTDLWSLGVVAYEALTGRPPFQAAAFTEMLARIYMDVPEGPSTLRPDLDPEVDTFFERALAKEPEARFASAIEMAAAFAALARRRSPGQPTKILVVDDEPDLALLIEQRFRKQIRQRVYEFLFAGEGAEALEVVRTHPDIDVALTDINMPGMDGLTFLSEVRKVSPVLKSIVITAYSDMNNIRRAMNYGAFDFLVKPLDFTDLETTLEKAAREVRELRKALRSMEENDALRMFVDPAVMERLMPMLQVSSSGTSESIDATVAFVDIYGFQEHARAASPEHAIDTLNQNFDVIVPVLGAWKGSIIRFVGDAVMAVFQDDDHMLRAGCACVEIRDRLARLAEEAGPASPFARGVCIGIDSGTVITGSVGSPSTRRLDYAVLGDVVSNAIKLGEAATKNQILVGEALFAQMAPLFLSQATGHAVMSPASVPIPIYSIQSLRNQLDAEGMEKRPGLARTLVIRGPAQTREDQTREGEDGEGEDSGDGD